MIRRSLICSLVIALGAISVDACTTFGRKSLDVVCGGGFDPKACVSGAYCSPSFYSDDVDAGPEH